jgi:hypothetical protein
MQSKEKLEMYPHISERIHELNIQRIDIISNKTRVNSMCDGNEGSITKDVAYKLFERYDNKLENITTEINNLIIDHKAISSGLMKMNLCEKIIIRGRVFGVNEWRSIPYETLYSQQHSDKMYHSALEIIEEEYRSIKKVEL